VTGTGEESQAGRSSVAGRATARCNHRRGGYVAGRSRRRRCTECVASTACIGRVRTRRTGVKQRACRCGAWTKSCASAVRGVQHDGCSSLSAEIAVCSAELDADATAVSGAARCHTIQSNSRPARQNTRRIIGGGSLRARVERGGRLRASLDRHRPACAGTPSACRRPACPGSHRCNHCRLCIRCPG
jgi:hypothetical protein